MQNIYVKSYFKGLLICSILTIITSLLFKECVNMIFLSFFFGMGTTEFIIDIINTHNLKSHKDDFLKSDKIRKMYNTILNEHIMANIIVFFFVDIVLFTLCFFIYYKQPSFFIITHFTMFMMIYVYYYIAFKTNINKIDHNIRYALKEVYGNEEEKNNDNEE